MASINIESLNQAALDERRRSVHADMLSQAITGELVGMANYSAMVELANGPTEQVDMVRHAHSELAHAEAFRRAARERALPVIVNPDANYWGQIRQIFLRHARAADLEACLIIQELMLESFAVALYRGLEELEDEGLARLFGIIADEEEKHVAHAVEDLAAFRSADADGFDAKLEALHDECMTVLAMMVAGKDGGGHCGLCAGRCVKSQLPTVGLDRARLRGRAIQQYLETLDAIGVPGDKSLGWIARLPL